MSEQTVTVGDTEVRVEETDDGFEAVEVADTEEDFDEPHIRFYLESSLSGTEYGGIVPLTADWKLVPESVFYGDDDGYFCAFYSEDDVSDLQNGRMKLARRAGGYDSGAYVKEVEILR